MYTHCPSCHTHFEITQEYLDIAHGKVRCGQCDHVFNALENLYNDDTPEPADEPTPETAPQSADESASESPDEPSTSDQFQNTEFSIPNVDIKEKMERIVASLSAATEELKNARKVNTFDNVAIEKKSKKAKFPAFNEITQTDDSLLDELLQIEDSLEINEISPAEDNLKIDKTSPAKDTLEIKETPVAEDALEIKETPASKDDLDIVAFSEDKSTQADSSIFTDFNVNKVDQNDLDILNSLIDDSEQNTPDSDLHNESDNIDKTLSDKSDSLDDEFSNLDDEFEQLGKGDDLLAELEQLENDFLNNTETPESHDSDKDHSQLDSSSPAEAYSTNDNSAADTSLDDKRDADDTELDSDNKLSKAPLIQDEIVPSFLTQNDSSSSNPKAILGWLASTIALLVVLAFQYLHFNSANFSQDPGIRPVLESLCPLTGCSLPLKSTPQKIVTVTHDVRTHSTVNNALEIQLTFKNKAAYTQSYPVLEITFSTPVGEIIARRKFLPYEYMKSNSYYSSGLKSNQSQEISLNVVDPDPNSLLSFQFNYL